MNQIYNLNVFEVVAANAGYGARIFLQDPTPADSELFDRLSKWGGPDKVHWDNEEVKGWEFGDAEFQILRAIIPALKRQRSKSLEELVIFKRPALHLVRS